MRRTIWTGARLVAATAMLALALGAASAQASSTRWYLPYPFGINAETPGFSTRFLSGPRAAFNGPGPMGSYARFTKMRWTGWGSDRAVGRGMGAYCDRGGCEPRRRITITLTNRYPICNSGLLSYLDYRLTNFKPYFSRTLKSGIPGDLC